MPDRVEGDLVALQKVEVLLAAFRLQHASQAARAQLNSYQNGVGDGESLGSTEAQREAEARDTFALICDRLRLYRKDAVFMESCGLAEASKAIEAREALYTYLCSKRAWGDFRIFDRALSQRHFDPLVERVFARDAGSFLLEFGARWNDQRRVPEFDTFTRLAERSLQSWEPPSVRALWTTLYEGVERGVVPERVFTRLGRMVVEHDRMTAPELGEMLSELSRHRLSDTLENGSWLAQSGRAVALRPDSPPVLSLEGARSDPRVEFGFLAGRINQLSAELVTPENQRELVKLYQRAAEHAVPADPRSTHRTWRDEGLATIRGHALQSMYVRPEVYSREIITAALPLLKEPWHGNSGIIFRELIGFGSTAPRQLVLNVLRDLLVADTVAHALWEQCGIRSGSYFRQDRSKLVSLFREAIKTERTRGSGRDALYIGRLFGLLSCLYEEARFAVPDALEVLGIRSISMGTFGFVASPWKESRDPDPLVRAAARRFLRHWEQLLSRGILRKLQEDEGVDRRESLALHSRKGDSTP